MSQDAIYVAYLFTQRFLVPKTLYLKLHHNLHEKFPENFEMKTDAANRHSHTSHQKMLVVLSGLTTSRSFGDLNESNLMSEDYVKKFSDTFWRRCETVWLAVP